MTLQKNKVREIFAADVVVLALGVSSQNQLAQELKSSGANVRLIGDAAQTGRIAEAISSGFRASRAL